MSDRIPMTKVGYEKLKTEVDQLESEGKPPVNLKYEILEPYQNESGDKSLVTYDDEEQRTGTYQSPDGESWIGYGVGDGEASIGALINILLS